MVFEITVQSLMSGWFTSVPTYRDKLPHAARLTNKIRNSVALMSVTRRDPQLFGNDRYSRLPALNPPAEHVHVP